MTAHVHDPSSQRESRGLRPTPAGGAVATSTRSRWLVPGVAIVIVAAALVLGGVLSFSTVLYAGLFGCMLLMHTGGHGGHAGHGGGHESRGGGTAGDAEDLRQPSSGAQSATSVSGGGLDDLAQNDRSGSETHDHDQHRLHGCH